MTEERLSGALQENILTVLCFDDVNGKMIRGAVTPKLFDSAVFREIAGHAIDFIDQFGVAIKEHLPDHLEDILKGDDARKASTYERLLTNLFAAKETVNAEYVLSQLHKFVRQQNLKSSLVRAVEALEGGQVDLAEVEMQKGLQNQSLAFERGLSLGSSDDLMALFDRPEEEGFELGIEGLDYHGIIPRRKQLYSFMAARGRGKSWWLTHLAKRAILARWQPLVISLEMSETRYGVRFLQTFFSISKRHAEVNITRLQHSGHDLAGLVGEVVRRKTLQDDDIREFLKTKATREFRKRPPFIIKSFPSGQLTIPQLEAYLDGLERYEKFVPDVILLDYPGIMTLDPDNLRTALGQIMIQLRGIAQARNLAMCVVHQGNRDSENASLVTGSMASEDISILAHSDALVTYSQTPQEHKMNLARLYVEKARDEEGKMQILLSQAYHMGQFCLDSAVVNSRYKEMLNPNREEGGERRRRDEDDQPRRRRRE